MAIAIFFVGHWVLSVFCQSFFQHRYSAHRMFTMSRGWERFFYLLTYVCQGSSFLTPKGYAILHRMHHAFSDTPKDPHSPRNFSNPAAMLIGMRNTYHGFAHDQVEPEKRFDGGYPRWLALDRLGNSWAGRLAWSAGYIAFYAAFATAWWQFLLLPIHFVMGPTHGMIVNWCGHKYGYRNFETGDDARNTLFFDFVTMGELFQNNHHEFGMSPTFAARWFEVDPTYVIMRGLHAVGIIDLGAKPQTIRWPAAPPVDDAIGADAEE